MCWFAACSVGVGGICSEWTCGAGECVVCVRRLEDVENLFFTYRYDVAEHDRLQRTKGRRQGRIVRRGTRRGGRRGRGGRGGRGHGRGRGIIGGGGHSGRPRSPRRPPSRLADAAAEGRIFPLQESFQAPHQDRLLFDNSPIHPLHMLRILVPTTTCTRPPRPAKKPPRGGGRGMPRRSAIKVDALGGEAVADA